MRIGLLICDHVRMEYQKEHGDYPAMFRDFLPDLTFVEYEVVNGEFPKSIEECDAYMCTGSKHSVYEDIPWIHQLSDFVKTLHHHKKKFIGVCFGHQMIGHVLGGKVEKSPNGWCVGIHTFEMKVQKEWMQPGKSTLNVLMMCQDQIIDLPPGAELLASGPICPHAILQIGDHILSIQGHPEFTKEYDKVLMLAREDRMGSDVVQAGLKSLEKEVDRGILRGWIEQFLSL